MLFGPGVSIVDLTVGPLSISLHEPFVIASGRMDATRAALVRATLEDGGGRRATGLGESVPRCRRSPARTSPSCCS